MSLLTPLSSLKVSRHFIPAHSGFPNTSIQNKPLMIYRQTFNPKTLTKSSISDHLTSIGVIQPQWVYPMYKEHHYHSTTHEVLIILSGSARICFGGPKNEGNVVQVISKGDVIVIPAGVAHAMLQDMYDESNDDVEAEKGIGTGMVKGETTKEKFMMLGCYPIGSEQWDHCTGFVSGAEERIRKLDWFVKDPIYGDEGPAVVNV